MDIANTEFYGNSLLVWLGAAAIAVVVYIAARIVQRFITHRLAKLAGRTDTKIDDQILEIINRTNPLFLLILALYAGAIFLVIPKSVRDLVNAAMVIALLAQAAIWGSHLVSVWIARLVARRRAEDAAGATALGVLSTPLKLLIWLIAALIALDTIGIDVTALVAGLGIGGLAVALATQNILSDLFASLSIILDKPFMVGDFIIVDDQLGTVERIGLKTTRVRALSGETVVFANNDLLKSRVRNYKQMAERRAVFGFGVIYQTPADMVEAIPGIVREIIEAAPDTRFDRGHFKAFGPSSLDFEFVYYMTVPDYANYMDTQQAINLALMRRFEKDGVEFAYPTQTIFVEKLGGDATAA